MAAVRSAMALRPHRAAQPEGLRMPSPGGRPAKGFVRGFALDGAASEGTGGSRPHHSLCS